MELTETSLNSLINSRHQRAVRNGQSTDRSGQSTDRNGQSTDRKVVAADVTQASVLGL